MKLMKINNYKDFKKKFLKHFNYLRGQNKEFDVFISSFNNIGDVFVVGGYIRSIIADIEPRDIDIIINSDLKTLENQIFKYFKKIKKNRLDGYKIFLPNLVIDTWSYESNWIENRSLTKGRNSLRNIAIGSFYNFDSLVLNINSMELISKFYNDCISSNTLDILLKNWKYRKYNPTKEANFLRAVLLRKKFKFDLSHTLIEYLIYLTKMFDAVNSSAVERLIDYSKSDEKYKKINRNDIESFLENLYSSSSLSNHNSSQLKLNLF